VDTRIDREALMALRALRALHFNLCGRTLALQGSMTERALKIQCHSCFYHETPCHRQREKRQNEF
jgi:hypothetical protein